jgi:hypothetical protein
MTAPLHKKRLKLKYNSDLTSAIISFKRIKFWSFTSRNGFEDLKSEVVWTVNSLNSVWLLFIFQLFFVKNTCWIISLVQQSKNLLYRHDTESSLIKKICLGSRGWRCGHLSARQVPRLLWKYNLRHAGDGNRYKTLYHWITVTSVPVINRLSY